MHDRPHLSCQVDHDMRHYYFDRQSGLPFSYWDSPHRRRGEWLVVGIAVASVIAISLWFTGWWG